MRPSILALAGYGLVIIAGAAVAGSAVASEMPKTTAEEQTITVKPGDTIYAIGRQHGIAPADLIAANEIAPPYQLQVGQELTLPGDEPASITPVTVTYDTVERKITGEAAPTAIKASATPDEPVAAIKTSMTPVRDQAGMTPAVERLDAIYTVRAGDTMYSLARRFEMPLEDLAAANEVATPYTLSVGQKLIIPGAVTADLVRVPKREPEVAEATPVTEPATPTDDARIAARELGMMNAVATTDNSADDAILISKSRDSRFAWPIRGSIVETYGRNEAGIRNDGINIAAPVGAPIRAAADGEVIYTGAELEGYGNLLLVRHEDGWVSAYAHADSIVVKKGDTVRQGQVVAKVGRTGSVEQPQLHFELRHELQPRDPLAALEGRDLKAAAIN